MKSRALVALALFACSCARKAESSSLVEHAAFGVFFGGQIQDRQELPFELDPARQTQGIRVDFRAPLKQPVIVAWEIARPQSAKAAKSDAGVERVTEVGEAPARVGESRFDVPLSFRQGQIPGTWHVRVKAGSEVVIDRDVVVYDRRERRDHDAGR